MPNIKYMMTDLGEYTNISLDCVSHRNQLYPNTLKLIIAQLSSEGMVSYMGCH